MQIFYSEKQRERDEMKLKFIWSKKCQKKKTQKTANNSDCNQKGE